MSVLSLPAGRQVDAAPAFFLITLLGVQKSNARAASDVGKQIWIGRRLGGKTEKPGGSARFLRFLFKEKIW
jgi:hypothetical protein